MKKILLLVCIFLTMTLFALAQSDYKGLVSEGARLYKAKDFVKSLEMYRLAFKKQKANKSDLYNGACSAALAGDNKSAIRLLNLSIDNGWSDISQLKSDTDLTVLHTSPEWNKLVKKLQLKVDDIEANYNKDAKKKLEDVYRSDQGIRTEYISAQKISGGKSAKVDSLGKVMIYYDSLNTIKVTQILDQYGWLGEDKVGVRGNLTLFLVIQHSDLKTQQKYLPMLRIAVDNGKASPSSLALLEDRVALTEGKKQIYGSQVSSIPNLPGKYYLSPMIDPDNVDKRRASVGLQPIAEYLKRWDINWDVEFYKKMLPKYEQWESKVKQ